MGRHNVQRSLAAQLQQISLATLKAQKDYLREIRRNQNPQQQRHLQGLQQQQQQAPDDVETGRPSNGDFGAPGSALRMEWLQQQEEMEDIAAHRSSEISQIAASVTELHQIFKD